MSESTNPSSDDVYDAVTLRDVVEAGAVTALDGREFANTTVASAEPGAASVWPLLSVAREKR